MQADEGLKFRTLPLGSLWIGKHEWKSTSRKGLITQGFNVGTKLKVVDRQRNKATIQIVNQAGDVSEWLLIFKNSDTFTFSNPQIIKQGAPALESRIDGSGRVTENVFSYDGTAIRSDGSTVIFQGRFVSEK